MKQSDGVTQIKTFLKCTISRRSYVNLITLLNNELKYGQSI